MRIAIEFIVLRGVDVPLLLMRVGWHLTFQLYMLQNIGEKSESYTFALLLPLVEVHHTCLVGHEFGWQLPVLLTFHLFSILINKVVLVFLFIIPARKI